MMGRLDLQDLDLLVEPLALDVCLAAKEEQPASAYQLAKAVKRQQGSLKRLLPKLVSAGVLIERSDRRGTREVKVYVFNEDWSRAVGEAVRKKTVGHLVPGGRVILVGSSGAEAAAKLLQEERFKEQVGWIVEFEDSTLVLAIGLQPEVDPAVSSALLPALRRLGLRRDGDALRLMIGRAFDQSEVDRWIGEILDGPTPRSALSPGSK